MYDADQGNGAGVLLDAKTYANCVPGEFMT